MNAFELAKKKYEKNQERAARTAANRVEPAKKEEPKVEVKPPMKVKVSGPVDLEFTILASGERHPDAVAQMFKQQLAVFGRVL